MSKCHEMEEKCSRQREGHVQKPSSRRIETGVFAELKVDLCS